MTDKQQGETQYGAQRRYSDKQNDRGFVKVTVWVPEDKRERTLKYASKLRKDHTAEV